MSFTPISDEGDEGNYCKDTNSACDMIDRLHRV